MGMIIDYVIARRRELRNRGTAILYCLSSLFSEARGAGYVTGMTGAPGGFLKG
jgi:hypothetical protein